MQVPPVAHQVKNNRIVVIMTAAQEQSSCDTTLTKIFVGGLAWETQRETMRRHFEQYGEIIEAVIITDKNTGRSKGYGFVTFCDPEAARRACLDSTPVIDGRRANCNLACLGANRSRPTFPFPTGSQVRFIAPGGSTYIGAPAYALPAQYAVPATSFPYQAYVYAPAYSQEYAYQPNVYNTAYAAASSGPPTYTQIYPYALPSSSSQQQLLATANYMQQQQHLYGSPASPITTMSQSYSGTGGGYHLPIAGVGITYNNYSNIATSSSTTPQLLAMAAPVLTPVLQLPPQQQLPVCSEESQQPSG